MEVRRKASSRDNKLTILGKAENFIYRSRISEILVTKGADVTYIVTKS